MFTKDQRKTSLSSSSRVLAESTNTRKGSTHHLSQVGNQKDGRRKAPAKSSADKQRGSTATLHDLNPTDKAKIARLVDQVMQLTAENTSLEEDLRCAQNQSTESEEKMKLLSTENESLKDKRKHALLLLHQYQDKICFFDEELTYTRKAYDELSKRYNSAQENIASLESLVSNQKLTIEKEQQRKHSATEAAMELQQLKNELRQNKEDCARYKSNFESQENTSKYLASQLDSLLSQLADKTNRISALEADIEKDDEASKKLEKSTPESPKRLTDPLRKSNPEPKSTQSKSNIIESPNFLPLDCNASYNADYANHDRSGSLDVVKPTTESCATQTYSAPATEEGNEKALSSLSQTSDERKAHSPEQLLESWSLEQRTEEANTDERDVNTTSALPNEVDTISDYPRDVCKSIDMAQEIRVTESMKEAAGVQLSAPPLSLTPPRRLRSDKARDQAQSHSFNDSSLGSCEREGALSDQFFLQRSSFPSATNQRNISPEVVAVAVKQETSQSLEGTENIVSHNETMKVKRRSLHKNKNKMKQPSDAQGNRFMSKTQPKSKKQLEIREGKLQQKKAPRGNNAAATHPTVSKSRSNHQASESPGLKVWEDASKNYDGYDIQLFDLLDQMEEGISKENSLMLSGDGSYSKMFDNSAMWM